MHLRLCYNLLPACLHEEAAQVMAAAALTCEKSNLFLYTKGFQFFSRLSPSAAIFAVSSMY